MKDDLLYFIHVRECIERIVQFTVGGRDVFMADVKTQDAVLRNLQILAESCQRISDERKSLEPTIDWRRISAFRNVLVHDYLGVDLQRIWEIVETDVPQLRFNVEAILARLQ